MCLRRVIVLFRKATRRHGAEDAAQTAKKGSEVAREERNGRSAPRGVAPGGEKGWLGHGVLAVGLVGCSGLLGSLVGGLALLSIERIGQLHQGTVAGIPDVAVCELGKP